MRGLQRWTEDTLIDDGEVLFQEGVFQNHPAAWFVWVERDRQIAHMNVLRDTPLDGQDTWYVSVGIEANPWPISIHPMDRYHTYSLPHNVAMLIYGELVRQTVVYGYNAFVRETKNILARAP